MRRFKWAAAAAGFAATMALSAPAFAQSDGSDGAGAAAGIFSLCCGGVFILLMFALLGLWVWMLIDAILRQEWEYPNSSGNSKVLWIVLLVLFSYITAIVYFFAVFRKQKRGVVPPPGAGSIPPAPQAPPAPPAPPAAPPAPPAPPTE